MRRWLPLLVAFAMLLVPGAGARAQSDISRQFAPQGKLRFGVLMLSYFAIEEGGTLKGWGPDVGNELARSLAVPAELVPIHNPADMIEAFKSGRIDATFKTIGRIAMQAQIAGRSAHRYRVEIR